MDARKRRRTWAGALLSAVLLIFALSLAPAQALDGERHAIAAMMIDAGGYITVVGTIGETGEAIPRLMLWRFLPDGEPDPALGGRGVVAVPGEERRQDDHGRVVGVAPGGAGRVVVLAQRGPQGQGGPVLWRLDQQGRMDSGFGLNGEALGGRPTAKGHPFDRLTVQALLRDRQGNLLALGGTANGQGQPGGAMVLWRFLPNGVPDSQFGAEGVAVWQFRLGRSRGGAQGFALSQDDAGRILVAGSVTVSGREMPAAWRFLGSGSADRAFGRQGLAVLPAGRGLAGRAAGIAEDERGGILVAGHLRGATGGGFATWRVVTVGRVASRYGRRGLALLKLPGRNPNARGMALLPGGVVAVTGEVEAGDGALRMAVAMFKPDGSPDTRFRGEGRIVAEDQSAPAGSAGRAILADSEQRLLVAGETLTSGGPHLTLWRFLPDGSLDPDFGSNGVVRVP